MASWVAINAIRKVGKQEPVRHLLRGHGAGGGRLPRGRARPRSASSRTSASPSTPRSLRHAGHRQDRGHHRSSARAWPSRSWTAGSISHRGLLDEFVALAEKKKIPYQLEILPLGGTDPSIQQARIGRRTITLSIPTRYIHTITEAVHKKDLKAAVDLLAAWLMGG